MREHIEQLLREQSDHKAVCREFVTLLREANEETFEELRQTMRECWGERSPMLLSRRHDFSHHFVAVINSDGDLFGFVDFGGRLKRLECVEVAELSHPAVDESQLVRLLYPEVPEDTLSKEELKVMENSLCDWLEPILSFDSSELLYDLAKGPMWERYLNDSSWSSYGAEDPLPYAFGDLDINRAEFVSCFRPERITSIQVLTYDSIWCYFFDLKNFSFPMLGGVSVDCRFNQEGNVTLDFEFV
ncbi:MAG: hypothetical protein CL920_31800 [Deltaproteobacteria bacterium]|nr:hypothetical protein [Deltaproteobacteria bacterium]MBU53304.1 hypothetical protein [Deltaproteobacteria bacterium]|tara:strand:- start:9493 stop:10224 length:732 start_codon:yes stop_codon:yes gene_type:complete